MLAAERMFMIEPGDRLRELVAEVAAAYFSNSPVSSAEIPTVIEQIANSLANVGGAPAAVAEAKTEEVEEVTLQAPKLTAAQIRKSITSDALISFEDGKPYKTLKRHLSTRGLTVEAYKAKWGLPADYPVVSPSYSAARSAMAKSLGLGQKGGRKKGAKG